MMTANLAAKNQKTLQQLAQAMALSRGQFKLILVRCNYGQACERWSKELSQTCRDQHQFELSQVYLPRQAKNLIDVLNSIRQLPPEGVQVLGLNQLADVRQFLANSNQIRDRLRRDCPFPIAIWLDDNSLTEMLDSANDLHSWTTSKHFYPTPDDLEQELHHLLDLFFQRLPQASPEQWLGSQPLLSQSEQRELDLAQTELNRDLSPNLQADLAIIQSHQYLVQQELSQAEQQREQGVKFWQTISPPTPNSQKRLGWLAFQQAILPLWRSEQQQTHLHYLDLHPLHTYFQESQQHFQAAAEPDLAHLVANAAVVQLVSSLSEITHPETSPDPARFDHLAAVNEQLCQQESVPFPNLWLNALEQLHQFYFQRRQDYRRAFSIQQQQWQVQRYGGQRAFVGASRLQGILYQRCSLDNLPPEIQESGREEDVRNLQGRLSGTQNKILVIHGQSGVGKSSLINAGLLPVLREKTFSGGLEGVPILVRLYQPWTETLETAIDQTSQRHKKSLAAITQELPQQRIAAKLQALEKQHCQVILVFDQFEEFFFANPGQPDHEEFFGFIGGLCSNIQQLGALKVVFSLRTDYVGQLLLCNDLESMDCIGRDILSRQVLHKLGNLSPQRTSQVLAKLAPHLEAELRTRLVADLSQETGAVRPIELQLVGFQLESQQIREMSAYKALGEHPKQQLVQGYLDDIVRACGAEQERLANGVLYLLTDERRRRPLRSYEELRQDLQPIPQAPQGQALQDALDLVLEIFTASGLVVVIPGEPQRYQLVHDYLAELIYESRQSDLIASLREEQRKRLAAERTLEELEQRQTQVKRRTRWLSAVGVLVIAVSLGAAVWGNRELNTARLITRLERHSRLALQQFERNDELEALLTATRTARELQQTTPSNQNYRTVRPIASLSGILQDIRLRNTWEAHSDSVRSAKFNGDGTRVISASDDGMIKLWDVATGNLLQSFESHSLPVISAEFNDDGTQVVSTSGDRTVELWDVATGERLYCFKETGSLHINKIDDACKRGRGRSLTIGWFHPSESAKFNRDETQVVSISNDGKVKLWDVRSGKLLHSLNAHSSRVNSTEFNGNSTRVISASDDGTVKLWDVSRGRLIHSFEAHSSPVYSAKFGQNGNSVISASGDGTVKLWDVATGELIHSLEGHLSWVNSADFNEDSTKVVSASGDGTVKLWDVATGELLHSLNAHSEPVASAEFNRDGTRVVSASGDGTVKIWNVSSGELLHSLNGHSGLVGSAEFNRDGTKVVSASDDGTVKLWQIGQKNPVQSFQIDPSFSIEEPFPILIGDRQYSDFFESDDISILSAEFNTDATRMVSASWDGTLKLWDISSGELIHSFDGHGRTSASVEFKKFNRNGTQVVSASWDGIVKIWDTTSGELLNSFDVNSREAKSDVITEVFFEESEPILDRVIGAGFNRDSTQVVSASLGGTVKLWDVITKELIQSFETYSRWVNSAEFSGDGTQILSASSDGTVQLWDVSSGELIHSFEAHSGSVISAKFNRDGTRVVSASSDGILKLWDVSSGQLIQSFDNHGRGVRSAEFNRDGTKVVSTSDDGTVKLWDGSSGELLHSFEAHSGSVISAKFNENGTQVVSVSSDGTVKIWKVQTLDELLHRACDWLRPYLTHNPNVTEGDRALCNIPPPETSPSD